MEKKILTIDQGTTGTRAMIFTSDGLPVKSGWAYREHRQIYFMPGWVEHNPEEIWMNTKMVIKEVIEKSRVKTEEVSAIGVTNQRETTVIWDFKTGKPVYNAIVWQDRRTAPLADLLKEEFLSLIRSKTGLLPDPYFSGTKIWWLLDNIPGLREKAKKGRVVFGTIDTWLIWNHSAASTAVKR